MCSKLHPTCFIIIPCFGGGCLCASQVEISCKGSSKMLKNHAGLRPSRLDPKWVDHAPPREMSVMPPPPTS